MTNEGRLKWLLDVEEIRDLARRYAHCVWQRDVDGAVALFTADGSMDTGDGPPLVGRAQLREVYASIFAKQELRPFVHNHVIEVAGDRATGACYLDLRAVVAGTCMMGQGWYDDRYVRDAGVWRFASRRLHMLRYVPEGGAVA